jgi:PAS domain S-box-containing protein
MNKKANILVVDDNSENLILLCSLLNKEGYNTFPADSGELALVSLGNKIPDLILLDIKMSGVGGFEVCKRIKQREDLSRIPIIFLSAATEIEDKLEGFRLGAADYVTKPFQKEELLVRVKTQLDIFFLNKTLNEQNDRIASLNEENNATIEELKNTKEKVEKSEASFRSIFENNSVAICIIEPDSTISDVNKEYCKLSGYTREEVIGMSWTKQIPPEDLERLKEYNQKRMIDPNNAPDKYEFTFYRKTGEIRHAFMSVIMLSNKKIIASFLDITERKQTDAVLRNAEERYRNILQTTKDGFWTISLPDGRFTDVNETYCEMSGYSKDELLKLHISDIDTALTPEEQMATIRKIIADGWLIFETSHKRKDGSVFDVELSVTYQNTESGVLICFCRDISYRKFEEKVLKQSETKLLRLNADKDRFISILGHDLRNPFNNLLGLSEVLTEEIHNLKIDEIEDIAKNINKSARFTYKLLEDILMWARTQQGKIPFKPQTLFLNDIFTNILETLKPTADSKNITVNCAKASQIDVYADADMLKTVLRNLISNAIKFTHNYGAIDIVAVKNSFDVTISVSDNGVGITSDNLRKLFDITQVLATKGTAEEKGTGLGLMLCKEFVEKHGGKIWVESEEEKGSKFSFTLPISPKTAV